LGGGWLEHVFSPLSQRANTFAHEWSKEMGQEAWKRGARFPKRPLETGESAAAARLNCVGEISKKNGRKDQQKGPEQVGDWEKKEVRRKGETNSHILKV